MINVHSRQKHVGAMILKLHEAEITLIVWSEVGIFVMKGYVYLRKSSDKSFLSTLDTTEVD